MTHTKITTSFLYRSRQDLRNKSIPGTIANAILWPAIFIPFDFHQHAPVLAWSCAAAMAIISALRILLYHGFKHRLQSPTLTLWLGLFTTCSLSQAAIWGGLFAMVIHQHAFAPVSFALILVIAGVASGVVPALSTVLSLALANLLVILTPAIVSCFYFEQYSLGALIVVYLITLSSICVTSAKQYRAAFNTEHQLKESQRQMDILVNSIDGVLWEYDIAARQCIFVNRRVESILGYSPAEWMALGFDALIHEDDQHLLKVLYDPDQPGGDIKCRLRKSSGDYAWIRNIVTIEYNHDTPHIARGAFFDITKAIKAADEHKSLQLRIQQGQKLEAIGQLAAGVAHEINTPIQFIGDNISFVRDGNQDLCSYIKNCEQLLQAARQQQFEPALTQVITDQAEQAAIDYLLEEIPTALTEAKEGTDRVANIVRTMKEFSHPGSTEAQRIDINRAINSTIIMAKNEWKHHATVDFTPNELIPLVTCFAGELNQVLLNIIVNAAHAIQEKGPTDEPGLITITTEQQDQQVNITISDNGIGMPDAVIQRAFDPFYTTKEVGKGTGQGLSIAHAIIVEQHGGKIAIDSSEGVGTTFTLCLPLNSHLLDAA